RAGAAAERVEDLSGPTIARITSLAQTRRSERLYFFLRLRNSVSPWHMSRSKLAKTTSLPSRGGVPSTNIRHDRSSQTPPISTAAPLTSFTFHAVIVAPTTIAVISGARP